MGGGCVEIADMGEKGGYGNLTLTFVFRSSCELTYISLLLWYSEGLSLNKASNKMDGRMDGQTDGRTDGRKDGRTNGWMEGFLLQTLSWGVGL